MTKKAIICIDDERIILQALKTQLKSHYGSKYIYEFAESANEGLELLEELADEGIEILVIVSDWLMPKMKGDDFLIEVHKRHPKISKVLLTGQSDEASIIRAEKGANLHCFLNKPWAEEELFKAIDSAI